MQSYDFVPSEGGPCRNVYLLLVVPGDRLVVCCRLLRVLVSDSRYHHGLMEPPCLYYYSYHESFYLFGDVSGKI